MTTKRRAVSEPVMGLDELGRAKPDALRIVKTLLHGDLEIEEPYWEVMRLLATHSGQRVEPAGAAGLAALVAHPEAFANRTIAAVLCGSNLTPEQIREYGLA